MEFASVAGPGQLLGAVRSLRRGATPPRPERRRTRPQHIAPASAQYIPAADILAVA